MVIQYDVYWISLDPTRGSEIKKTRPCVVISPNVTNRLLNTVLIAPITSSIRKFPMRTDVKLKNKKGQIALDQIRCVGKERILDKIGPLKKSEVKILRQVLKEYLIDE